MTKIVENLVIGQGLAGSAVAWTLNAAGQTVHIVDKADAATASRVSGGLVTPMTGKRLVKSTDFEEYWEAAEPFYREVERTTGTSFLKVGRMQRLFENEQQRAEFRQRSESEAVEQLVDWTGELQAGGRTQTGISMSPSARLDTTRYLEATRHYFEKRGAFTEGAITTSPSKPAASDHLSVSIGGEELSVRRVFHCTGAATNELFCEVPDNPSRGDILEVSIPQYISRDVVHRSIWIAPLADNRQLVGSTYDWKNVSPEPTEDGRRQLLSQLERIVDGPVQVHRHKGGVRPTMKDYEPVIGRHPDYPDQYLLNGLGSKGILRAPLLAKRLLEVAEGRAVVPPKQDFCRLKKVERRRQSPLTSIAQQEVSKVLGEGDHAVDGTVGNGFDTCFLAASVGESGTVLGFDIQASAIESTGKRLAAQELKNVDLRQSSHEKLSEAGGPETQTAVMFNLGYLPRSSKTIVTTAETSTKAISAAMDLLKPGGVLTVLAYRGHEGGQEEYRAVEELIQGRAVDNEVKRIDSDPPKNHSPVLFIFTKGTGNHVHSASHQSSGRHSEESSSTAS